MKFVMTGRRKRKTEPKAWPPPYADLPPLEVLEALSQGDEQPYRDWRDRQGGSPPDIETSVIRKLRGGRESRPAEQRMGPRSKKRRPAGVPKEGAGLLEV